MGNMTTNEQKRLFKDWLQSSRKISQSTLIAYTEDILFKLKEIITLSSNEKVKSLNPNMYFYQTKTEFDNFVNTIKNDPNFDIINKTGQAQSGWVSTPLNHYGKFLLFNISNKDTSNANINLLRERLIEFYKTKGVEIKETGAYTALKHDKNLAEIHKPAKQTNRFKIVINYELLSDEFKIGVKRVPDSYNWTNLNGEFWIDSEETLNGAIQKINNILSNISQNNNIRNKQGDAMKNISLNQILYGPPGTGKTYNTVLKAMSIIDNIEYKDISNDEYGMLKIRFDKLKQAGQIEFITFHQSYSYEEFVEGIKPEISNWESTAGNLNYVGKDGIFKQICNRAEKDLYRIVKNEEINFNRVHELFKEKYEPGSDFLNLKNIQYEDNNLVYHFGSQAGDRRIDLNKIREIFNSNKRYTTAIEFNKDYKGNNPLKGYFFNFYKELIKIKDDYEKENQDKSNINQNANKYVLIVDEINRGNISKIFGELITLIEPDKRLGGNCELQVSLPYSQEIFGVPKNLYIIGTMNTSDRSIASIDIALRRRFKFVEMMPKKELVADFRIGFADIFENLNIKIKILLDRDHQIGHSYFIKTKYENAGIDELKAIWFSEILPLLNEYFYCDWEKLKLVIPGFIKKVDIPSALKNDCDEDIYEFKTFNEVDDFEAALKSEKFEG